MKIGPMAGAAIAALFAASGASAQMAQPGWYGALDLGYHFPLNRDYKSLGTAPDGQIYNWQFDPKDDWTGFVRLGYRFNPHWRVELEGGYRNDEYNRIHATQASRVAAGEPNGVCSTSSVLPSCAKPDAHGRTYTAMVNAIYDLLPADSTWVPFVGAGVGVNFTHIDLNGEINSTAGTPAVQTIRMRTADGQLAYQVLAGIAYKYNDRVNLDLTYRFIGSNALEYHSYNTTAGGGDLQPGIFKAHYTDNSVTLGIRYAFASPPPPPAVVL